ncbi:MAG: hypothetical protein QOJ92_1885 [Frankiales bacterium]|jgi:hypothetical protein|nr:hypothetical protein [Frankiales bacterium]
MKVQLSGKQIVALVAIVGATMVFTPVAVSAATGSFVNITDPTTASYKARVNSAGGLWGTLVDPVSKSQARVIGGRLSVGDTSGPLTVDGAVDAVETKPRQPYVMVLASAETTGTSVNNLGDVPAGKTFVIQTVTAEISVPKGQQPGKLLVYCPTGGTPASHYQQFLYQQTDESGSYDEFMATNDVHIYCDGGSTIQGVAIRNSGAGYWHLYMTLSGYLA